MPRPGRNYPCPCGSGRKTKHCCGEQRGPSEEQLARAHVAELARRAAPALAGLPDRALDHLADELMDLPAIDLSLLITLPRLIGPDLERLCEAIEHDDPEWGWDALTAVHKQIDTPQQRARLADAVVRLRDQNRIGHRQAAFALLNLHSNSNRFIAASLLEAVAVHTGVKRTPGGLKIAA
ncbi:MAG TPA: SEC-C metal-binding domain-containing protein [Gaiellales bacterium]|nr:SEC-C metal-binding domain-containing protein [Gaiellales bacterium]